MLGVLEDATLALGSGFTAPGDALVLLGVTEPDDFGGSEYGAVVHGALGGAPPRLDLERERSLHELLKWAARARLLSSAHDLSGGGLAVAAAESALAGGLGFEITAPEDVVPHRWLFSESASRALVSLPPPKLEALRAAAAEEGVEVTELGTVGGATLDFGCFRMALAEAISAHDTPPF
jgi:phosphoribosylformylglycinamidine synthase